MKRRKILNKNITPEEEQEIRRNLQENPLTKTDIKAMIISALITLLPAVLIVIGIFVLIIWLFFLR